MEKFYHTKTLISGVVTNTDFNANVKDIVRPTAALTIYDAMNKEWIPDIYVIFSNNGDARQFKGIRVGDILLVSGELNYIQETGYVIYATEYTILYHNKVSDIKKNRVLLFNECNQQNFSFITGQLVSYNNENQIATITYPSHYNIRGNIANQYTIPIHTLNQIDIDQNLLQNCVFHGWISQDYAEGYIDLIHSTTY